MALPAHRRWMLALVALAVVNGSAHGDAAADPSGAAPPSTPAPPTPPSPRPVAPGTADATSKSAEAKPSAKRPRSHDKGRSIQSAAAIATFPGFTLLPDGGSRVYVQLTAAVGVDERKSAKEIVYVLHGAAVPVRNNRNPLMTGHFNTPVSRARLVATSTDVKLVVELRTAATPTHRLTTGTDGTTTLEIDFAPGNYVDEAKAAADDAKAKAATDAHAEPQPQSEPKPE